MLMSVGRFFRPGVTTLSVVAITLILLVGSPNTPATQQYVLATASPGGTYHPVGVAIATLVKAELSIEHGIDMVAVSTAGSAENLALLHSGDADFAIAQALVSHDAWTGVRSFSRDGPRRGFRAVTALWQNTEQFVLLSQYVKTGTIDDLIALEGAMVGFGKRGSGTLLSNRVLLEHFGVDIDRHYRLAYLGYGPAADALQAGEIVAVSMPAGVPTKALTRAKAAMGEGITILSFTDRQVVQADKGLGLWSPYTIAAGTYPDQTNDVKTIAQRNLLDRERQQPARRGRRRRRRRRLPNREVDIRETRVFESHALGRRRHHFEGCIDWPSRSSASGGGAILQGFGIACA